MSEAPFLEARDLGVEFTTRSGASARALDGVHLSVHRGEILAVVGESGSGKTTLARTLIGLQAPTSGEVTDGDQLSYATTIHAKLGESELLQEQAENNTPEQFYASPDLLATFNDAIIASMDAHQSMSTQVLSDDRIKLGLLHLVMHQMGLYDYLRARRRA